MSAARVVTVTVDSPTVPDAIVTVTVTYPSHGVDWSIAPSAIAFTAATDAASKLSGDVPF